MRSNREWNEKRWENEQYTCNCLLNGRDEQKLMATSVFLIITTSGGRYRAVVIAGGDIDTKPGFGAWLVDIVVPFLYLDTIVVLVVLPKGCLSVFGVFVVKLFVLFALFDDGNGVI